MKMVNVLLIVLSAVLYAVPFLYSACVWWLAFLFPIPLLYAANGDNVGFKYGFLWGLATFLLHGVGGVAVVMHMAHEKCFFGLMLGLAIVIYQAMCTGLIFWVFQRCARFFNMQCMVSKICINTLMIAFVIFWVDRGCFFIFGVVEGYPLMHPLIVLVQYPPLLFLLPFIGKQLLTIVFLCFSTTLVSFLFFRNRVACMCVIFAIIPWLLSVGLYSMQPVIQEPSWVKRIVAFAYMTLDKSSYPIGMVKSVGQRMKLLIDCYPTVDCIIAPESAFDSEILSTVPELLELWGESSLCKPITFIFGASRVRGGKYYNCVHWIYNGVLQQCFDKRHTMLLSERMPEWLDCGIVRSMYRVNGCCEVSCGVSHRSVIDIQDVMFVPYLCSELFFNEYPHDLSAEALAEEGVYNNQPIIALVNDSVFGQSHHSCYIRDVLVLLARFKAMMWQRDIVYVSYTHTVFIDKQGTVNELQQ